LIISERHLNARDFSDGLSKVIQLMPELQMDCPSIFKLVFDNMFVPLENLLDMKKIRWVENKKSKDKDKEESDEYLIEDTDA
jgi:hypothetical protein